MNIIFDLDGTLIDSAPDIQSVAGGILSELELPLLTLAETRSFIGEGAAVFVQRMLASRGIEPQSPLLDQVLATFLERYETAVDKAVFYPNVRAALNQFRADGHRLGLCTNKPAAAARAVLRHMKLEADFTCFVAGGMLNSQKPEPDMLLHAADRMGDGRVLYVGDSDIDALTAQRAAIPFALFSGGYRKAPVEQLHHDWVFDNFAELPDIVSQADNL